MANPDTLDIADRLDDLANYVLLIEPAVHGAMDGALDRHLTGGICGHAARISDQIRAILDEIHPPHPDPRECSSAS